MRCPKIVAVVGISRRSGEGEDSWDILEFGLARHSLDVLRLGR